MIRWQVQRLVTDTAQHAENDPELAARMAAALDEYARKLPPEQQAQLRQQLGVTELTRDALKRTAQAGVLGGALYATVEAAGFTAYTTLSSILASLSGALGLTLPFGAYTFASSALAILSSPVFVGPTALVVLGLGWHKIRSHLDTHLPATIIGLAILQRYAVPDADPDPPLLAAARTWTELQDRWQGFVVEEERLRSRLESLAVEKRRRQEQCRVVSQARAEATTLGATLERARALAAQLEHHAHWETQLAFLVEECAANLTGCEHQIQALDQEIREIRQGLARLEQTRRTWEQPIQAIVSSFQRRS